MPQVVALVARSEGAAHYGSCEGFGEVTAAVLLAGDSVLQDSGMMLGLNVTVEQWRLNVRGLLSLCACAWAHSFCSMQLGCAHWAFPSSSPLCSSSCAHHLPEALEGLTEL